MAQHTVNWQAVIDGIAVMEAKTEILLNKQSKRYVRLQRFVREHGQGQSRDATLKIAQEFGLTWRHARNLYIELGHLSVIHRMASTWESVPARNSVKRELERVQESIRRIANFQAASSQRNSDALHYLANAADRWAEKQNLETLRHHGFQPTQFRAPLSGVSGMDFGSTAAIRGWFELASLMHQFAETAIKKLGTDQRKIHWHRNDGVISAIVRLVGGQLPDLYVRATGEIFGVSNVFEKAEAVTKARDVRGVRFVGMALEAMGLKRLKPETIVSYRKQYRKAAGMVD